ncbi:MAG: cellulase family glycosylhydrolase [Chitinophagaceae bacterium]|nr:cellulase family glycosylhydrolase [Chitinophagaceae bacterium]
MQKWPLFLLIVSLTMQAHAQGFLSVKGQDIVNENGKNVLLRGIGLGGWMLQEGYMLRIREDGQQHNIRKRIESLIGPEKTSAFYDSWLKNYINKADVDSLKAWGFNSIRLPLHYNLFTLPSEKEPVKGINTWIEKGFNLTDSLLSWCKANQIYLILDLHAAPGGQGNDLNISDRDPSLPSLWESDANQQKTIALWKKLATRYANEPWIGGYDILNEPNWGFDDPVNDKNGLKETNNIPLKKLLVEITSAIREVDKNHIIIIEGNGWGNNYSGMLPPWDKNMVLSFHKYWNYNDQHSIQYILDYRKKYNIPVWIGETGENSNVWYTQAVRLFEENNIGWAWWPLKKLGNNNPLQIPDNTLYNKLLNYWQGKGSRPSAGEAYQAVMSLSESAKIENNIVKYDVIDALIRQPFSDESKPFKSHTIIPGSIIHAVDYDLGGNRIAYMDTDTTDYHISDESTGGNQGKVYRNDGVDIIRSSNSNNYYVFNIESGEWLQYTVNSPNQNKYHLKFIVRGLKSGGQINFQLNGKSLFTVEVPIGNSWSEISLPSVNFSQGKNIIRVLAEKGGFEFKDIRITEKLIE